MYVFINTLVALEQPLNKEGIWGISTILYKMHMAVPAEASLLNECVRG